MINPPLVIPNTFVNGTVIDAGQMNANFAQEINFLNSNGRFAITQNITFFVAPGGSDSGNTGLNQNSPCATVNYVFRLLQEQYIWANASAIVTIQLAPGSYTESINLVGVIPGQPDQLNLFINGDINNPSSYTINGAPAFSVTHGAQATIQGVTLSSSAGDCIYADTGGFAQFGNVIFATAQRYHVFAQAGGIIRVSANYTVSGNMNAHLFASGAGAGIYFATVALSALVQGAIVVTLTGSPTFSTAWALLNTLGNITSFNNLSFANASAGVGRQYSITTNSVFLTGTGGTLVLPGNVAGVANTGGIYN